MMLMIGLVEMLAGLPRFLIERPAVGSLGSIQDEWGSIPHAQLGNEGHMECLWGRLTHP